jgi:diguanylate cyclase (GGDEF)-like protein
MIDKLELLYKQSVHSVIAVAIAAIVWLALLWDNLDPLLRNIWIGAMALAIMVRQGLIFAYFRAKPTGHAVLAWYRPFVLTIFLSTATWGVGAVIVTPHDTIPLLITFSFLIGFAGTAIPAYGLITLMAVSVITILVGPISMLWLMRGDTLSILLGLASLWFVLTAIRSLVTHNATIYRSFQLAHELRFAKQEAEHIADTDALTGLRNRRAFAIAGNALVELAAREKRRTSMMLIDVDDFKGINDNFGHATGDMVLQQIATILRQEIRGSDVAGRLGGDEFAVVLPGTDAKSAYDVAARVLHEAQSFVMDARTGKVGISLSIGLADGANSVEMLLIRADAAMYQAKRGGKNQIAIHMFVPKEDTQPMKPIPKDR